MEADCLQLKDAYLDVVAIGALNGSLEVGFRFAALGIGGNG